ncbi:DUF4347 domain-containing protein [Nostoc sp. 'Lobaria pulmonaria (5183) cyanobiont']|uniref:DUF4347 domain-containing protein n=1 Tax=Nostoc sp. 'Lobaria pulmonaria (5183) cyanobiont' TaxID=1618022 RepID=UPI000CF30B96|nr:DUF4347 domain-containing protein [Nostoc sp. 'Lobaria pulmonaria (5183) cyanobiont']AVH68999.1 Ig family protein [Nostoc sp. 'Lobaria pulmonaria (5183) cyanobiont']
MARLHTPHFQLNSVIPTLYTHNLVFIDTAVEDYQSLINGVIPSTEVFVIDPTQNGVEQITQILATCADQNLSNIHIVCHGAPGSLQLGNTHLGLDTLECHSQQLQQWQKIFSASSKTAKSFITNLLIYGCNVADGDLGSEFIGKLHQLTGANIAASRQLIGSVALGGNWDLEVCIGDMELTLAFSETTREAYAGVLATFTVNSTGDADDGDPNNGITTLREAVNLANATTGDDAIAFGGVFTDTTPDVITLTSGKLTITDDVSILGTGTSQLTVSGNNTSRVFEISGLATGVTIDGLAIASGGIQINSNSILSLTGSSISGNTEESGISNNGILNLTGSTVFGNTKGGIYNSSILSLTGSRVFGNTGDFGGGIYNDGSNARVGTLKITASTVSGNTANYGGGIYNKGGTLNITASTVSGNRANYNGGGVVNGDDGGYGGGSATLTNSTISGNTANDEGGGIYDSGSYSGDNLTLSNTTITSNIADSDGNGVGNGGGVASYGSPMNVSNTIIAGNFDNSTSGDIHSDVSGSVADFGNNLIGDNTGSTNFTTSTLVGTIASPIDPKIGPLQNNGGATFTHALLADSPAINAGNNSLVPVGVSTDQRGAGFDRLSSVAIDIGSYEVHPTIITPPDNPDPLVPTIRIIATDNTADENSGDTSIYRISRSNSSGALTVNFSANGNASIADYNLSVGSNPVIDNSIVIADGQSYVDITLTPVNDIQAEAAENLTLSLAADSAYQIDNVDYIATVAIAANDFVVTNTNDSGDGSLRQAILNANAFAGADTITFAGVFSDATPDIITLTSGKLTITDDITLLGTGAANLIVSGNNASGVFEISGTGTDASIDGLKIANANDPFGGILLNNNTSLNLTQSIVSDGRGTVGGIFNKGTLSLTSSTVSSNRGSSLGGGIFNKGNLSLTNSIVSGNSASTNYSSASGGGIFNIGTLSLTGSTISGNGVSASGQSRYEPDPYPSYGGGIYNSGSVSLSNSTISGNSALSGGGISNSSILNITNSTVSGNTASGGDGGGISSSGILNLNSTTITNNTAEDLYNWGGGTGGGVSGGGTVIVANTIIAGNFNNRNLYGGDINPDVSGDFTDDGNNLIGDNTGSAGFTTSSIVGSSANPIDPKLSPLQNNGGATLTHALLVDSRAINAGNNALIPAGITTDQRSVGFDRVSEGTVDIGALEFNGLIGTSGADNLVGNNYADIIDAEVGNDIITGNQDNDFLTGGGGKDKFVYNLGDGVDTISDFGELGKGSNPSAAIVGELDTLKFQGTELTARNLLLTQNSNNLEITFEGVVDDKVILQNFALENLDNLSSIGNILFDGQSSIRDSFDVFNANSTQSTIFNKNTVTFVNDLNNNVNGFDNSDDVINGQGGDDRIDGKSGNDLLRGGAGNDTLIGGAGDDILIGGRGKDILTGGSGHDQFIYQTLTVPSDTITDFHQSEDKLVLTNLFKSQGYTGSNPIGDGYLHFVQLGTSTQVSYGKDYTDTFVTLDNFTATNLVVGSNVLV